MSVYGAKVQSEFDSYRFGLTNLPQELSVKHDKYVSFALEELAKTHNLGFYDSGFGDNDELYRYRPQIVFVGYAEFGNPDQKKHLGNFYKEFAKIFPAAFFAKIGEGNYRNSTDTEILIKDVPKLAPMLLKRPYISDGFSKDVLSELEKLGCHVEFNSRHELQKQINAAKASRTSDKLYPIEHLELLIEADENHAIDRVRAYLKMNRKIAVQSLDASSLFMKFPQQRAKELGMSYVCMLPRRK